MTSLSYELKHSVTGGLARPELFELGWRKNTVLPRIIFHQIVQITIYKITIKISLNV